MMQYLMCIPVSLFFKIKLEEIVRTIDKLFSKLFFLWFFLSWQEIKDCSFRVHPINTNTTYFAALEASQATDCRIPENRIEL